MLGHLSGVEIEVIVRLAVAALLGALLGLERSLSGKHAGMRTYALVSLGSALFTVVGVVASYQFTQFVSVNPLTLAGFIVVGIGFIGAGLSASADGKGHSELTTATGVWLAAGIGITAGFGFNGVAFAATVLGILIFSLLLRLENKLRRKYGKETDQLT